MTRFRDLPIRRKLLLMTLASSTTALVLASCGFLAWEMAQVRSEISEDVTAQARLLAENVATPVTFGDNRAAGEMLASLRLRPRVEMACLYSASGALFATYQRDRSAVCPLLPAPDAAFQWGFFQILAPVVDVDDNRTVATLYVRRELGDFYERLRVGATAVAGFLVVAILAAFLIATRMQRSIASPLLQLADTARTISTSRDYALRAVPAANDEIGVVVRAFNDMLDRIAERNAGLSKANTELEREVQERRRVETERTAALERERDANRLKDEFLATLSHELRTPLNAVLGWTRVLRSGRVESTTQGRALESIERNARVQARLVEDLLEISRIVTGKLRLQVRDVDLAGVIEAAVEIVLPAAAAKRLRLTVDLAPRPAMTAGDPDRLQQVVWNILSNAVKFTPPEGRIAVKLERRTGYVLTVQDSGAGIDPQFLPYVFEPFRQADGTASREHGGLGLGLAIAKQLVELHGGTIKAQSAGRGHGAIIEIGLPSIVAPSVDDIVRSPAVTALPADPVDASLLRPLRVLVVDDEEDARMLLATALTTYGADVAAVGSAAEALAEIDRRLPDVLLSDIGMPHEDGYSLIQRLRERPASRGGTIPAVAITAYASTADRMATEAAGYQAHVAKPFEPIDVVHLVAQLGHGTHSHQR